MGLYSRGKRNTRLCDIQSQFSSGAPEKGKLPSRTQCRGEQWERVACFTSRGKYVLNLCIGKHFVHCCSLLSCIATMLTAYTFLLGMECNCLNHGFPCVGFLITRDCLHGWDF
ncbi:hypothetical protein DsansV1_C27g0204441 [Dioscorea sansibarensis]